MMKKVWRMLLLAGVFTVLLCVSALAAGEGMYAVTGVTPDVATTETVTINEKAETLYVGAEKVTLTYGSAVEGKYYLVLALNDGSATPTVSNIAYIDQVAADESGSVSFTVYPNKLENGKTYNVYLSSNDGTLNTLTKQGSFSYYMPYKLGDINEDTKITATDALWVLQAAAGNRTLVGGAMSAADVNLDSKITATDALWILQIAAGNRVLG